MLNGYAGRAEILAAAKALRTVELEVDGIGTVRLREMGARERGVLDDLLGGLPPGERVRGLRSFLIMLSVVDGEGNLQFSEADLPTLDCLPGDAATALQQRIMELSKLGARMAEAEAKNSESGRTESSSSNLPGRSDTQA